MRAVCFDKMLPGRMKGVLSLGTRSKPIAEQHHYMTSLETECLCLEASIDQHKLSWDVFGEMLTILNDHG